MVHQKNRFANLFIMTIVAAVFGFSLYVLLTTENTIIVVNEAAAEPKEMFVGENEQPSLDPEAQAPTPNPRIEILETDVGFLNVRDDSSVQAKKIGTVKPGEVYEYTETKNGWYHIVHPELDNAWISGQYAKEVNRSSDLFGGESLDN